MLVPGRYEKKLLLAKFNTDIASPAILQETLALYIPVSYTHLDVYKRQGMGG